MISAASCKPVSERQGGHAVCVYFHGASSVPGLIRPYVPDMLEAGYDVVAPMLPGHGTKMEDMLLHGCADWLRAAEETMEEVLEQYDTIHVCGHSLGGALAAYAAGKYADSGKIGKVLLMCPGFDIRGDDFKKMDYEKVGGQKIDFVIADPPAEFRDCFFLYPGMYLKSVADLLECGPQCADMVSEIRAPLTVWTAGQDFICDTAYTKRLVMGVSSLVEYHVFTKAGHDIMIDPLAYRQVHERFRLWLQED